MGIGWDREWEWNRIEYDLKGTNGFRSLKLLKDIYACSS